MTLGLLTSFWLSLFAGEMPRRERVAERLSRCQKPLEKKHPAVMSVSFPLTPVLLTIPSTLYASYTDAKFP